MTYNVAIRLATPEPITDWLTERELNPQIKMVFEDNIVTDDVLFMFNDRKEAIWFALEFRHLLTR